MDKTRQSRSRAKAPSTRKARKPAIEPVQFQVEVHEEEITESMSVTRQVVRDPVMLSSLLALRNSPKRKRGRTDYSEDETTHYEDGSSPIRPSSSSSLGSRCVPWLGEGLSMLSPNYPVLCFPLPYRVAPVFV